MQQPDDVSQDPPRESSERRDDSFGFFFGR
jgi:hypothetical protein